MAAIKELAGQTLWYGVSSIGAKFLNYLLTPILTYLMADASGVSDYGGYSLLYSWIAVTNIIFTYGFETGYFRFSNKENINRIVLFQTTFGSIIISTFLFITILSFFKVSINNFMNLEGHPEYIIWCLCLIGLDALCAIPFAKLRQENRPKRYAFIKLSGIIVNIIFTLLFLVWLPENTEDNFNASIIQWFNNQNRIGLLLLANIIQNFIVFLMLFSEWKNFRFRIDINLWKEVFKYSTPMILIGLAGMINEVMDRQMLAKLLPANTDAQKVVGIYAANYKLAIFITLFIQAFKMAAEPFFFNQSKEDNAHHLYARVMKWFVIILSLAFLFSSLYLDIWQYLIGAPYRSGLDIVPILLCANICLGIYYNLSVWYKLTDHMQMGLYITIFGTIITLAGNYFFIPHWGIYAAAWTTLLCYASMMILTYFIGQKFYFIPYPVKRIGFYLCIMLICFFLKMYLDHLTLSLNKSLQIITRFLIASVLFLSYILLIIKTERAELKEMQLIKKFFS